MRRLFWVLALAAALSGCASSGSLDNSGGRYNGAYGGVSSGYGATP